MKRKSISDGQSIEKISD